MAILKSEVVKKSPEKRRALARSGTLLAKKQFAALKKWAGRNLGKGFAGKDHDRILHEDER